MDTSCTVYNTVGLISRKWSLLVILSIYKSGSGKKQYSHIKGDLQGITPKILSSRLKELEEEGIITKVIDDSRIPVNTYYSLTGAGKDLVKVIREMKRWGLRWKFDNLVCENSRCRDCTF